MKRYAEWSPTGHDCKGLNLADRQDWLASSISRNRDSDCLDESNFAVVSRDLDAIDPEGNDHEIHRFGHWACGWFEIMIVRPDSAAHKALESSEASLANYCILDDQDFAEREEEAANLTWKNCFGPRERIEYMRDNWEQFESCHAKYYPETAWRSILANVRGEYFSGNASELLA